MTKGATERANIVRADGLVNVKKSGAVQIDWAKAVRSDFLKEEVKKMIELQTALKDPQK